MPDGAPLLMIRQRLAEPRAPAGRLVLAYDLRCRSRFRACLADGSEAGVVLERGQVLRDGDLLLADDGRAILVVAAPEWVTTLRCNDPVRLARAAYHLGNRHVALQIGESWLRYRHDHVLDDMAKGLGLDVTVEQQPFEPEAGAYHPHGAGAGHGHVHSHAHGAGS
jgi:urease accessory protein